MPQPPETCLCATTEGYRCPVEGHAALWCRQHPMFDDEGKEKADRPGYRHNGEGGVSAFDLRDIFSQVLRRRGRI